MKGYKRKNYNAVGFVEALIAIAVAGIASIVLMTIAVNTTSQLIRNEIENNLTERSVEAASMVKKIAANHNESPEGEALFPLISGNEGNCYAFNGDSNDPSFETEGADFKIACKYDAGERELCREHTSQDSEIFRVFCILSDSVPASGLVVGKIVTGMANCEAEADRGKCKIRDYQYYLGVKVDQE
ncbi:hypothetical protein HYV12_00420 [Candidatus Dojkabacteria bacterium]|nr:hypothetical protein [Candidatus Dojkabacteria bacterium]